MKGYTKNVVTHSKFYIVKFSKDLNRPYIIFIHGGPGLNCGVMEYLVEREELFNNLEYNIIFYDQRTCGRSINFSSEPVHKDNVNDLNEIYLFLVESERLKIKGFIGHSYGAKLLFDFIQQYKVNIPVVFVATADSILTPRMNNFLLDLKFLATKDSKKYKEVLEKMDNLSLEKLWELTEELNPLFQENKNRPFAYWANLDWYAKFQEIQKTINLPINNKAFMSVRKDLYSTLENFSVDIASLKMPFLWINGLHDYIMNGQDTLFKKSPKITFFKSAHYPHIEENERFCEVINEFVNRI